MGKIQIVVVFALLAAFAGLSLAGETVRMDESRERIVNASAAEEDSGRAGQSPLLNAMVDDRALGGAEPAQGEDGGLGRALSQSAGLLTFFAATFAMLALAAAAMFHVSSGQEEGARGEDGREGPEGPSGMGRARARESAEILGRIEERVRKREELEGKGGTAS